MGLFSRLKTARMSDPVRGSAQVVAGSAFHGEATWQSCALSLVVSADGVPPTAVEWRGLARGSKWPQAGSVLPVTLDRANPQSLKIEWDEVPKSEDVARQSAEGLAAMMRGEGSAVGGLGGAGGAQVINLSGGDLSDLSDEQEAKLRSLGIDPGQLAGAMAGAVGTPASGQDGADDVEDQVALLERLAALHAQGVLTDEELREQKARILGE